MRQRDADPVLCEGQVVSLERTVRSVRGGSVEREGRFGKRGYGVGGRDGGSSRCEGGDADREAALPAWEGGIVDREDGFVGCDVGAGHRGSGLSWRDDGTGCIGDRATENGSGIIRRGGDLRDRERGFGDCEGSVDGRDGLIEDREVDFLGRDACAVGREIQLEAAGRHSRSGIDLQPGDVSAHIPYANV